MDFSFRFRIEHVEPTDLFVRALVHVPFSQWANSPRTSCLSGLSWSPASDPTVQSTKHRMQFLADRWMRGAAQECKQACSPARTFRMQTDSSTSLMPMGGLLMDLRIEMSFCLSVSSACIAASIAGIASARFRSHSSRMPRASAADWFALSSSSSRFAFTAAISFVSAHIHWKPS